MHRKRKKKNNASTTSMIFTRGRHCGWDLAECVWDLAGWLERLAANVNAATLIKKKIKFSSYIGKFREEQLQNHIWLTASSYMGKYFRISSYIRKPFLMTLQLLHSEFPYLWGKFSFLFYQCRVLSSIPASSGSDAFQSEGRQMKQCSIKYIE